MKNHQKFIEFVNKFKNTDPHLVESVLSGYSILFEESTEQRVNQIKTKLDIKPLDEAKPVGVEGGLDKIYSDLEPAELDKQKDTPVEPTT